MNLLYDEKLDGPLPPVDRTALIEELQQTLPDMTLLHEREDLQPFECDGLAAYRILPMLVVIPDTVDQVQAFMKICHQRKVPVVARGAGTGLSGGALPLEGGVLLVLARLKTILEINPEGRFARVQPGVRKLRRLISFITHRIHPRKLPVRSAATWPRTLAVCIA
jgi:glycolate oxidase